MKRLGNLFERAFTLEALHNAYLLARKGKRAKRACFQFEKYLGTNLERLHREIHDGSYKPKPYFPFKVYEPKPRLIYAPSFCDLVVQHAIYAVAGPIFERGFIDQSFACRVGLGTHKAADYAQHALQQVPRASYVLKLDIRKFFYRIDRAVLRLQIERKIKDRRFVDLMMQFAEYGEPIGIPIGNLLSQLYALIYLNPLDHFIKRVLKVKRYCRYVDDFVLFGLARETLLAMKARVVAFLGGLRMELSRWTLAPASRGVNFVGYRAWAGKRFIRKRSLYNFRKAVGREMLESVVSILGHARRTHSLRHLLTLISERNHALVRRLPQIYRQPGHARAAPA